MCRKKLQCLIIRSNNILLFKFWLSFKCVFHSQKYVSSVCARVLLCFKLFRITESISSYTGSTNPCIMNITHAYTRAYKYMHTPLWLKLSRDKPVD